MKQLLQNLRTGELLLEDIAAPLAQPGHLVIQSSVSLISPGTERMLLDFGRASLVGKAVQQPERVRQVIAKIKTDGLAATLNAVESKLDQPIPLGYCNVGLVMAVGAGVEGYAIGDRVASNGPHAEIVSRPVNLCARIPDSVTDDQAVFTVVGAVALQGMRLVAPTFGESVVVFGLGMIGLLAGQLLKAAGARVLAFDMDPTRVDLARGLGIEAALAAEDFDPVRMAVQFSRSTGVDAVLITASTQDDTLIHQSAQMCRKRGRIVLTGTTGLQLQRSDFYEKELEFQVSCAYGPGRYDPEYEAGGKDYPEPYVRWTLQRNFVAVLDALATGQMNIQPLISRRFTFSDVAAAYACLDDRSHIGLLLTYPLPAGGEGSRAFHRPTATPSVIIRREGNSQVSGVVVGIIGAGQFVQGQLLPALGGLSVRMKWIASREGVSGAIAARKGDIERHTTDINEVLHDPEVEAVFIMTRHDSHSRLVCAALAAEKHVFVEKPLCLTPAELASIETAYDAVVRCDSPPVVMAGFNRRFAPLTRELKSALAGRVGPLASVYTCNAGAVPEGHWSRVTREGGGRLLGEAVHFVDYLRFLTGSPIREIHALPARVGGRVSDEIAVVSLAFDDGSIGQINYVATGSKDFPKERVECFFDGKVLCLDNFRVLEGFGVSVGHGRMRQDKGHKAGFAAFIEAVQTGKESPIPFAELCEIQRAAMTMAGVS